MKKYINSIYIKENDKLKDSYSFSGKLDEIIKDLKDVVNEKGYINLSISKRKNPTKNQTHYIYKFYKDE